MKQFGAALSLLDSDDDGPPDIIVGAAGAENPDQALWAYFSHEDHGVGPNADPATGLGQQVSLTAGTPLYIGR